MHISSAVRVSSYHASKFSSVTNCAAASSCGMPSAVSARNASRSARAFSTMESLRMARAAVPFLNAFVVYIWFSPVMPIAFVMMARILELAPAASIACSTNVISLASFFTGT